MLNFEINIECNIDIVFVIDAVATMKPIIDELQQVDLVYDKLLEVCLSSGGSINSIRFKVIWYRDFFVDGGKTYGESRFFEMPKESENFKEYIGEIDAYGGSNTRRPGLAALSMALGSDFVQEGDKKRHIIIQFTDASSYSFEEMYDLKRHCQINDGMLAKRLNDIPDSYEVFFDWWEDNVTYPLGSQITEMLRYNPYAQLDQNGKRLILCAPEVYPWFDLGIELTNTLLIRRDLSSVNRVEDIFDIFIYR